MFKFNDITTEELQVAIEKASFINNISEVIIEKDYWVCFMLNYLFTESKWKNLFVFKGGTSLSKCYGIIKRFSEDIDLILDWRAIGYEKYEPWSERTSTQQDKFNKNANLKTQDFLIKKFIPNVINDLKILIKNPFEIFIDPLDNQTIIFKYPKIFDNNYIRQEIRLEIGPLAAWTPSEDILIKPDLYNDFPKMFSGDGIIVKSVSPQRTFWKKITILHQKANRPNNVFIPKRQARHYYDVYSFMNSKYIKDALIDIKLLYKVVQFKQKFYYTKWAKYEEATIDKIKIVPEEYRINEIKEDYEHMKQMIYGDIPPFELIIENLKILEEQIHKLNKK